MDVKSLLITLEGPDGGGKTTQIRRLTQYLAERGIPFFATREPGGTQIGDRVRDILLDPSLSDIAPTTEMMLYAASRSQLVEQVIRPALDQGKIVICDRFVDSSIVYQGMGSSKKYLQQAITINQLATGGLKPQRTYVLDLPVKEGKNRLYSRGSEVDRIEGKGDSFHQKIRDGFLDLARKEPERFLVVDATQSVTEVFEILRRDLEQQLEKRNDREKGGCGR